MVLGAVAWVYVSQNNKINKADHQVSVLQNSKITLQKENFLLTNQLSQATSKLVQLGRVYHIGDTQSGVTLVGMYYSSYQDMMAGNGPTPPTTNTIVFALSGVNTMDAENSSIVLTTVGSFTLPDSRQAPIAACGTNACVGFDVSNSNSNSPKYTASTFFYKNLEWQLF